MPERPRPTVHAVGTVNADYAISVDGPLQQAAGADTEPVRGAHRKTGITAVLVPPDGSSTMVYAPGANGSRNVYVKLTVAAVDAVAAAACAVSGFGGQASLPDRTACTAMADRVRTANRPELRQGVPGSG